MCDGIGGVFLAANLAFHGAFHKWKFDGMAVELDTHMRDHVHRLFPHLEMASDCAKVSAAEIVRRCTKLNCKGIFLVGGPPASHSLQQVGSAAWMIPVPAP